MPREHLPHRRHGLTEPITTIDGRTILATVGFDPGTWSPRELFLTGAKEGSHMAFVLDDVSVVISVALQHGITAREMAHSVSPGRASVLGAALELIAHYEEHGPDVPRPAAVLRIV
jgi:hypothetical protein